MTEQKKLNWLPSATLKTKQTHTQISNLVLYFVPPKKKHGSVFSWSKSQESKLWRFIRHLLWQWQCGCCLEPLVIFFSLSPWRVLFASLTLAFFTLKERQNDLPKKKGEWHPSPRKKIIEWKCLGTEHVVAGISLSLSLCAFRTWFFPLFAHYLGQSPKNKAVIKRNHTPQNMKAQGDKKRRHAHKHWLII